MTPPEQKPQIIQERRIPIYDWKDLDLLKAEGMTIGGPLKKGEVPFPISEEEEVAYIQWIVENPNNLYAIYRNLSENRYQDMINELLSGIRKNRTAAALGGQGSGKTMCILSDYIERLSAKWESGFFDTKGIETPKDKRFLDPSNIYNDVIEAADNFPNIARGQLILIDDPRQHISMEMEALFEMSCLGLADVMEKIREYGVDIFLTSVVLKVIPKSLLQTYAIPRFVNPNEMFAKVDRFRWDHADEKGRCVGYTITPHPLKLLKKAESKGYTKYHPEEFLREITQKKDEMMEKSLGKKLDRPLYRIFLELMEPKEIFIKFSATEKYRKELIGTRTHKSKILVELIEQIWSSTLYYFDCVQGNQYRTNINIVRVKFDEMKKYIEGMIYVDDDKLRNIVQKKAADETALLLHKPLVKV